MQNGMVRFSGFTKKDKQGNLILYFPNRDYYNNDKSSVNRIFKVM